MAAVGQVQSHDPAVGLQQGIVDGEVGGGAGVRLDVDAPLFGIKAEGFQGPILGQALELVNVLVATVVPRKEGNTFLFKKNFHRI